MWGQIEGENKIVIARKVLRGLADHLTEGSPVGLIAYGHRREGDCQDIETVLPLGPLDRAQLSRTVDALNPKGKTPITASVQQAFAALAKQSGPATVILVSDGLETCGGDPCAAVQAAKKQGIEFVLHVVGFDVAKEEVSQLECAAQAGDGRYFAADNAEDLAAALETAATLPATVPPGRLRVRVVADGRLQDATVVAQAAGQKEIGARTYASEATNPRRLPLADGTYQVRVRAVGIKGDIERRFTIDIADGSQVEREVDFSTGELVLGVRRNGELSDASYQVRVAGTGETAASGRTYRSASSNPAVVRITAGTYDIEFASIEISGRPTLQVSGQEVAPQGRREILREFASATVKIGARRGAALVDAGVRIFHRDTGKAVAQGRTYNHAASNPKTFVVEPGHYRVEVKEIRGKGQRELALDLEAGQEAEHLLELPAS
jgi:Ca-activated chloride channel family protein